MDAAGALASRAPDAELTLEQVAAMLSGAIGKPVPEIQAAGVVDMLHARRKLEATSAARIEPLAGEPGASSSGTDVNMRTPPGDVQESLVGELQDIEMVEPAENQVVEHGGVSRRAMPPALQAHPSPFRTTWIEHLDVEFIASWLAEQVETVKDPKRVLQLWTKW